MNLRFADLYYTQKTKRLAQDYVLRYVFFDDIIIDVDDDLLEPNQTTVKCYVMLLLLLDIL